MLWQPKRHQRRGSVLPLVAFMTVALIGLVALAIDLGMVAVARNQCQNAADASAMAGARTINGDSSGNYNVSSVPFNAITAALKKGGEVKIMGFGHFRVVKRAAREGRNPRTGSPVKIKAARRPRFSAGKALKAAVNR